jgi:hypothetical protein
MIDPDFALNSVLESLQSIPQLAVELGAPAIPATESITGHFFYSGEENAVARALAQMKSPSVMVGYLDYIMGNFNGMTMWKHRMLFCVRSRNAASDPNAASAPHLWWMAMNLPIAVPEIGPNIRYVDLANGNMWLFETMLKYQSDELGQDFFVATMVFNEMGDCGPDDQEFLCVGPSVKTIRHAPTVECFADAIRRNLSAGQRRLLFEELKEEEEGVTNGF